MLLFVFSEIIFFSGFFCAIFYSLYSREVTEINILRVDCLDPLGVPLLNTILLLSSGVSATYAHEIGLFGGSDSSYILMSIILRLLFFWYQFVEFSCSNFRIADGIFGSCFFSLTGFHGFHVVVRLCLLVLPLSRLLVGNSYYGKFAGLECSIIY
jgi:heme/copper-type cytochrome/quinol oxidase subunit 3